MRIETGWDGLEGLLKDLDHVAPAVAAGMSRSIRNSSKHARTAIKKAAPRKAKGPHRVAAGVRSRVRGKGVETTGKVYLRGTAIPVALGSKPHRIDPRNQALKFPDGGFARGVDHPGHGPNDFFQRGVSDSMPAIDAELDRIGQDIVKVVGG